MSEYEKLMQAAAGLPDSDLATLTALATRLKVTMAPTDFDLAAVMDAAPLDDEPVTTEELEAIAEGRADIDAGRIHSATAVRAMLGI